MNILIGFLPVIIVLILLYLCSLYYLNNALPEKKESDDNQDVCIFSYMTYMRFGFLNITRGFSGIKVSLYPKKMIIEKGDKQRTITNMDIYFDKLYWTDCMKISVPDMSYPITIELTTNQYKIMQKYLEVINTYNNEEDIINNFVMN